MTDRPNAIANSPDVLADAALRKDIQEKPAWSLSGGLAYAAFFLLIALIFLFPILAVVTIVAHHGLGGSVLPILVLCVVGFVVSLVLLSTTFVVIPPGQASAIVFFGSYLGTIAKSGVSMTVPLTVRQRISIRVHNVETNTIKVNDLDGNPINIGAIVVWRVADTAKALFAVEDYEEFVATQAEAALRHVAMSHPYDSQDPSVQTLLGSTDEVSADLAREVDARVAIAGVEIVEVRISALSYAPEIAKAMLQRQQATAVIAARERIVEGAVSMVADAMDRLERETSIPLSEDHRANMVANLLVVLCSESHTQPVVNTGAGAM